MTTHIPVAVLVVHGVGAQHSDFAAAMIEEITMRCASELRNGHGSEREIARQIIFRAVHWADVLQPMQETLWRRVSSAHDLDYVKLRKYMIDFAGDALAYQVTPQDREVYDAIHRCLDGELARLAQTIGVCPATPLAIIGHSLGTVIASNYIWDLQHAHHNHQSPTPETTPLQRGETLSRVFTLGSPIALWSLRFRRPPFGKPIHVPDPALRHHYPASKYPDLAGQWLNFFDEDDVIAYPLKSLNADYGRMVTADLPINVGGLLSSWNPFSHNGYWTDDDVTVPIARSLAALWRSVNTR